MADSAPRGNDALVAALADADRLEGKTAVIVLAPPSVTLGTRERDHMDDIRRTKPHLSEAWLVESTDDTGRSSLAVVVGLGPDDRAVVNAMMALVLEPLVQSRPPRVIPAPQPNDPDLLPSARRVGIRLV